MAFTETLLEWYDKNARALPWRFEQSAYRTWISEIMLQQTQVDTEQSIKLGSVNTLPEETHVMVLDLSL